MAVWRRVLRDLHTRQAEWDAHAQARETRPAAIMRVAKHEALVAAIETYLETDAAAAEWYRNTVPGPQTTPPPPSIYQLELPDTVVPLVELNEADGAELARLIQERSDGNITAHYAPWPRDEIPNRLAPGTTMAAGGIRQRWAKLGHDGGLSYFNLQATDAGVAAALEPTAVEEQQEVHETFVRDELAAMRNEDPSSPQ